MESPEVGSPEVGAPVAQGEEGVGGAEVGEGIEPSPEEVEEQGGRGGLSSPGLFCFFLFLFWFLFVALLAVTGGRRSGSPGLTRMWLGTGFG